MANEDAVGAVRHRVVNDLNLVHALISMAERRLEDPNARDALGTTRARIRTIALAHRQAWASLAEGSSARVDAQRFFASIIADVCEEMRSDESVELIQRIDPLSLDFDQAVALGLVLRELVDNAIRHGLGAQRGRVLIGFTRDGAELRLWVENDGSSSGRGIFANDRGVGLAVVDLLAEQLNARVSTKSLDAGGTRVELSAGFSEVCA